MYIDIYRTKIEKDEANKVKSHLIYEPHKRQSMKNLKFDKDGIFSKQIFGSFNKCECGNYDKEHYGEICPLCGVRVLDPNNIPDFYIDLSVRVPITLANYDALWFGKRNKKSIDPEEAEAIMNYDKFVYIDSEGNKIIQEFNPDDAEEKFGQYQIYYGTEAIKILGGTDEWIEENTSDFIGITHPIYRPLISSNMNTPYISSINNLYSNIIKKINDVISIKSIAADRPFFMMIGCKAINNLYKKIIAELFKEIQENRYSIIKSELISHPISGAARAVLINRHDIHEDVILIGDTLVETLWPYLYEKHKGNMIEINKELVDKNYVVLVNRPPTINHLSIIAMKPRIASLYPIGEIESTNMGLKHNYVYSQKVEDKYKLGIINRDVLLDKGLISEEEYKNFGDIERYGQGFQELINKNDKEERPYIEDESKWDGIDCTGLRCIAMNPVPMNGLSADVDGDCLLIMALYSSKAIFEATKYMLPSRSYMNYANGTIRNHIIDDFLYPL